MPRQSRDDRAGQIDHALNRGNQRQEIFHKPEDDEALIRVLAEALQKWADETVFDWFLLLTGVCGSEFLIGSRSP